MKIAHVLPFAGLTLLLTACGLLVPRPTVTSITPEDGASEVPQNTVIELQLNLQDSDLDITTLSDSSVLLEGPNGPVALERTLEGERITLDPSAYLAPNSTYTLSVTDALQTTNDQSFMPFSSSFTTGVPEDTGSLGEGDLQPDRLRLLFTAGNGSDSDTRTLTLVNEGERALNISNLTVGGNDAALFTLTSEPAFRIGPGNAEEVTVTFTPDASGPAQALLQIDSDDSVSPTQIVPLGGIGLSGSEEPSLQWILDAAGIPIWTGDTDPGTTELVDAPTNTLLGDELNAQALTQLPGEFRASVEVLGSFTVSNSPVASFGNYVSGSEEVTNELFRINAPSTEGVPANNHQRLQPNLTGRIEPSGDGLIRFIVGSAPNGFYGYWRKNDLFGPQSVYTEDALNTFDTATPHHVRVYPLKNPDGSVEAGAFVLAFEETAGSFDYNDLVVVVRGVEPAEGSGGGGGGGGSGIPGLELRNAIGLPSAERMVLSKVDNFSGDACIKQPPGCDPNRWASMKFYDTGRLVLQNTGNASMTLSLSSTQPALFSVTPSSVTLPPGGRETAEVTFIASGLPRKGVYSGLINATSGSQTASLEVAGIYQQRPEGSGELYIGDLITALGYETNVGATSNGALVRDEFDSPKAGNEVRSEFWRAANQGAPIVVTQLAAFMPCCNGNPQTFDFELFAQGSSSYFARLPYDPDYSQSIFPRGEGGNAPNRLSVRTGTTFRFDIAGYSSGPKNGFLGVRFWPLIDENGNRNPNTYIVAQDFARGPCGSGDAEGSGLASNCDYNDHLYLVTNITPVAPY